MIELINERYFHDLMMEIPVTVPNGRTLYKRWCKQFGLEELHYINGTLRLSGKRHAYIKKLCNDIPNINKEYERLNKIEKRLNKIEKIIKNIK